MEAQHAMQPPVHAHAEPPLPFPQEPFDESILRNVRDEIINNIQATYKETDLFKVFQTGAPISDAAPDFVTAFLF
jgi:hypothetical protein